MDGQKEVPHMRQIFRRVVQLVVVSGEERLGRFARVIVQKFDCRARSTIVGEVW